MSIISPIQYDSQPKPLYVRKNSQTFTPKFEVNYDYHSDCITIIKTESGVSNGRHIPAFIPRWQTISEDEQNDNECVYEEVNVNASQFADESHRKQVTNYVKF